MVLYIIICFCIMYYIICIFTILYSIEIAFLTWGFPCFFSLIFLDIFWDNPKYKSLRWRIHKFEYFWRLSWALHTKDQGIAYLENIKFRHFHSLKWSRFVLKKLDTIKIQSRNVWTVQCLFGYFWTQSRHNHECWHKSRICLDIFGQQKWYNQERLNF